MIIGLTGQEGVGVRETAKILEQMNFFCVSFTELLGEEFSKKTAAASKESIEKAKVTLSSTYGSGFLARLAEQRVKDGENFVFYPITEPEEAKHLFRREDFLLVQVKGQHMPGRHIDPRRQKVGQMARVSIHNDSAHLREKVERLVADWMFRLQDKRPDWDHYFMNIAEAVKLRCSCMSAKKGAVIVRDKQIISAGYNGTPKGIRHCTDGGCMRCTSRHMGRIKSGIYSEPCVCAHAEENSIVQAAYNGVSTKGATMYTTFTPCSNCAKLIINAGIVRVVARIEYPDETGRRLLHDAGIKFNVLKD